MAFFGRDSRSVSTVRDDGDGISRLMVYDSPEFSGDSKTIMESTANAANILGTGKKIASLVVQGNPWIFFPEENMKVVAA